MVGLLAEMIRKTGLPRVAHSTRAPEDQFVLSKVFATMALESSRVFVRLSAFGALEDVVLKTHT